MKKFWICFLIAFLFALFGDGIYGKPASCDTARMACEQEAKQQCKRYKGTNYNNTCFSQRYKACMIRKNCK